MTVVSRYIFRETFGAWLMVTGVLFVILMSNQFAEILDDAAVGRLPRDAVFSILGLTSLRYLTALIPIGLFLGVILALSYKFFLIFGISWLVLSFLFRFASLSSIVSSLIVFVYSYFFYNNFSLILFIFFIIILYTHRENIVRLKNSEESKIKL